MSGTNVVIFDYAVWAAMFPELAASVNDPQATGYFAIATVYVDNTACSPICNLTIRSTILNMVTAHIAKLLAPIVVNGVVEQPSSLVGRISDASEGSVSVAVDFPTTASSAWFLQTTYGALAWQALAPWRTALYIANNYAPTSVPGFFGPGFPGLFNGGFPCRI